MSEGRIILDEQRLAHSVISQAVLDLRKVLYKADRDLDPLDYRKVRREITDIVDFLTGKTGISQHWFDLAEMEYFENKHITEAVCQQVKRPGQKETKPLRNLPLLMAVLSTSQVMKRSRKLPQPSPPLKKSRKRAAL